MQNNKLFVRVLETGCTVLKRLYATYHSCQTVILSTARIGCRPHDPKVLDKCAHGNFDEQLIDVSIPRTCKGYCVCVSKELKLGKESQIP